MQDFEYCCIRINNNNFKMEKIKISYANRTAAAAYSEG